MRMQPMVIGHHYMASAGQYLATEAAHAILRAGGNAIDAGVISATIDLFLLHQLGHDDITLYDVSMGEWAKTESLPIETD